LEYASGYVDGCRHTAVSLSNCRPVAVVVKVYQPAIALSGLSRKVLESVPPERNNNNDKKHNPLYHGETIENIVRHYAVQENKL
jgi:uncharacterized protein (UPF0254 family)